MRGPSGKETAPRKELPANICAVLFDYDGVIADTMEDNDRAWKRAFAKHGVTLGEAEYLLLEGMTPRAVAEKLTNDYGLSPTLVDDIIADKAEFYRQDNQFRIYPGILEIVRSLKERGMKVALVSGAALHRIEDMTPKELLELFDVLITADDDVESKPSPEPYQRALEKMGVDPRKAVVIENAPLGIQSAKAAGCFCLALETTLPRNLLTGADMVFPSHQELADVFLND